MKVLICIMAFAVTVHGGLLPHLEAPLSVHSDQSSHQIPETNIIKLIHETASIPHATLPTPPLQILKIIHETAANVVNVAAPAVGKIIKVIHQSHTHTAPVPESPPKIVKVIHQSAPAPVSAVGSAKLLKVIHEYAPRHYGPAPEVQSTKILKVIKQQTVTPHPVSEAQNVRVFKVYRQVSGAGGSISSSAASHGVGQTYAKTYGHTHATPGSAVKIIKVLQKPVHHPTW